MPNKLECLFGFHKFDEVWKLRNINFFGSDVIKVCTTCRKCILFGVRLNFEMEETADQFVVPGPYKFYKELGNYISVVDVPFHCSHGYEYKDEYKKEV